MERRHEKEMEPARRLHELAMRGNVDSLIELLDQHPLLLHQIIVDGGYSETPLHVASMLGHTDFIQEILSRNRELALEQDSKGRLPLHLASVKGYEEIVEMLLEIEPQVTCMIRDEMGRTPLHVAAMKGRHRVIQKLLSANMDSISVLTHQGETVLHLAVKNNRYDALKIMLDLSEGSELLNSKDGEGNTILHVAVTQKQIQTVKYLVGESVPVMNINICNNNGLTPLDLSKVLQNRSDFRDIEIFRLLEDRKALSGLFRVEKTTTTTIKIDNNDKENDDWVDDMRGGVMVVASLIATVAFQAGLTPAGGLWQDTGNFKGTEPMHKAGQSIMGFYEKSHYRQYLVFNTISFISSLGIILLLISGFPLRNKVFVWTLMVFMWVACTSMTLTYSVSILFEAPNLTSFEDNLATYTYIAMGVLIGIVFLGNFLRLVVWLVKRHEQVKEIIVKKSLDMREIIVKNVRVFKDKGGRSDESRQDGV